MPYFGFTISGGLEKPYYLRLRELRKRYDLTDKAVIECSIEVALRAPEIFEMVVERYQATAPSEMEPLPEVV